MQPLHRAPAQMLVHEHALFPYRNFTELEYKNIQTQRKRWEQVLGHFEDIDLTFETIVGWTFGRWTCFAIWWTYTWQIALQSFGNLDGEKLDKELRDALTRDSIPGLTLHDFFQIEPSQIMESEMEDFRLKLRMNISELVYPGMIFCAGARGSEASGIPRIIFYFFMLRTKDFSPYDIFAVETVYDALYMLFQEWETSRMTFAAKFEALQRMDKLGADAQHENGNLSDVELWSLITADPRVCTQANHNAREASP